MTSSIVIAVGFDQIYVGLAHLYFVEHCHDCDGRVLLDSAILGMCRPCAENIADNEVYRQGAKHDVAQQLYSSSALCSSGLLGCAGVRWWV